MNYFFKYLIPQLLEYFNDDKEVLKFFIPKVIEENYKNEFIKIINNENIQSKK